MTSAIGAEVCGIDLATELPGHTIEALRRALLDHLVLVIRGQAHMTPDDQLRFCRYFGEVMPSTGGRAGDSTPGVSVLDQVNPRGQGSDQWHSDHMFTDDPPLGTVLRAVQLPSVGGDTCFASMYAAYDALSAPMRRLLDGLTAVNSPVQVVERVRAMGVYTSGVEDTPIRSAVHPVVRVHPETGRRALYASERDTVRIVELTDAESAVVLSMLRSRVPSPEFQVRVHWEEGTVVFWDNRSVQHLAVTDYHERRVMHRTMVAERS
jgi:taurine dioxygenase